MVISIQEIRGTIIAIVIIEVEIGLISIIME